MISLAVRAGLSPGFSPTPPDDSAIEEVVTAEAGLRPPAHVTLRVTPLVEEDACVPRGAPVACLRDAPDICLVAPMPARVARITLQPGRKLTEIVLFHDEGGGVQRHDVSGSSRPAGLRALMQRAGLWPWLRRRPFGGMPAVDEVPAAILVMAVDTRPAAPDPLVAIAGREESFERGLRALKRLTEGPVLVCHAAGREDAIPAMGVRVQPVPVGPRHPQGAAGIRLHEAWPAGLDAPVWDLHAEDVAALGRLLETGTLPMNRLVSVAGPALRAPRLVRTQPGASLRGLSFHDLHPGAHVLLSGDPLGGHPAEWLAPRDRQVSALSRPEAAAPPHWLIRALTRSARPRPVIPTAALDQAFGAQIPAAAFVRALSAGDDEMAMKLGALSLLEEDVALADYVLGGEADLQGMLRVMLDRIRTEFAA
ncbi:Na(+)-translocating NADH-quinone reductase subunit A [Pseudoponticoccus marisrubri]|uniref:Na(+)-translocating NADH-quinone reductase subunit A n=1 Tax=Pseudoponticoccus marisrubri TaxID=1685382 RepID=A0A0W7WKI5_9RHOB|nr:Na(+)-translocating NADH-quinone reductase subunit A [Pseudoponticoccus marisrubri]KUF11125.1 Na(+)-translocating NADH-quinone reductase subunit A [Pseudoponticoccus marisrubri]